LTTLAANGFSLENIQEICLAYTHQELYPLQTVIEQRFSV